MCGKCCRVVTASQPYEKLLELKSQGDKEASNFLGIFEPYESTEAAKAIDAPTVKNILKKYTQGEKLTFYKCKYLLDNNLCSKYKDRPEVCVRFPSSPWAVVPPGCGYEGWLFQKREEIKQKIRKLKEEAIEFEAAIKDGQPPETTEKLQAAIEKINKIVEHYAEYGSKDW
jgi:Fe-S-cluster containining protein